MDYGPDGSSTTPTKRVELSRRVFWSPWATLITISIVTYLVLVRFEFVFTSWIWTGAAFAALADLWHSDASMTLLGKSRVMEDLGRMEEEYGWLRCIVYPLTYNLVIPRAVRRQTIGTIFWSGCGWFLSMAWNLGWGSNLGTWIGFLMLGPSPCGWVVMLCAGAEWSCLSKLGSFLCSMTIDDTWTVPTWTVPTWIIPTWTIPTCMTPIMTIPASSILTWFTLEDRNTYKRTRDEGILNEKRTGYDDSKCSETNNEYQHPVYSTSKLSRKNRTESAKHQEQREVAMRLERLRVEIHKMEEVCAYTTASTYDDRRNFRQRKDKKQCEYQILMELYTAM